MEATAFLPARPTLPPARFSTCPTGNGLVKTKTVLVNAKQGETDHEGKPVDENMIVLRMRIEKMKVMEARNNEGASPSSDWKEWEKKLFVRYHEGVCDSIALLQSYLMNTRPSVALGLLALVALSVPLSTSVVMTDVLNVVKGLLSGCHVCIDIDF